MQKEYKVQLDFLGGAMEIGGSAILVEMAGQRILLDSGIRQKAGVDPLPDFRRIQERGGVDAIVVSHAHMDHTGTLPVISKAYPNARIYATAMTIDLARVLLYDSIKLMDRQQEGIPAYAQKDVEALFERMAGLRYEQEMEILPGVSLTLYQAGHIAGAACVLLRSADGTVFYSGDFSAFAQNTIEGIRLPKLRPDIAIVESTYGDRLHSNRQIEEKQLVETAAECVEKGGKMLIPTFALGRAQEVLLILKRAMARGELPKVRVYVDGMVRDMNTAYMRNPWFLKSALARQIGKGHDIFYSEEIVPVGPKDKREELVNMEGAAIFVSSSGMLTGGPSVEYAKRIAPMENGYIVITGYQDEEAPGRQILELLESPEGEERFLALGDTRVPVRCTLRKAGLSAHGDKSEIEGLLESLSARNVFLVHGDREVIPKLAAGLELDYRTRIFTPEAGNSECVWLKSPRQQLKKVFPYTMQKEAGLEGKEKEFYQYLQEHYPGRKFTLEDMAFIWYGRHGQTEEVLCDLQQCLLESRYFAQDNRRLFLFVCRSGEELAREEQKDSLMTPQRLQEKIEQYFAGLPYKKISYFMEKEEVLLKFDFPYEVREQFPKAAADFSEDTGWTVSCGTDPNEHAMQMLLQGYFGTAIQRISIRKQEECVEVRLGRQPEPELLNKAVRDFESRTGYFLLFDGAGEGAGRTGQASADGAAFKREEKRAGLSFFEPSGADMAKAKMLEQNLAFSRIDSEFGPARHAPYKKSIQSDGSGRYIQLFFLSPALGYRQKDVLQRCADKTGWRIAIAPGVNQNAVITYAAQCCQMHGVECRKLPSYQPGEQRLVLKLCGEYEQTEQVCREIEEETGVPCVAEL